MRSPPHSRLLGWPPPWIITCILSHELLARILRLQIGDGTKKGKKTAQKVFKKYNLIASICLAHMCLTGMRVAEMTLARMYPSRTYTLHAYMPRKLVPSRCVPQKLVPSHTYVSREHVPHTCPSIHNWVHYLELMKEKRWHNRKIEAVFGAQPPQTPILEPNQSPPREPHDFGPPILFMNHHGLANLIQFHSKLCAQNKFKQKQQFSCRFIIL